MGLGQLAAAIRSGWWLPLIGLLVGGLAALGVTQLQTPVYTSSTELFLSTGSSPTPAQAGELSQRAASYARLLTGQELAERVIDELQLDMSAGELQRNITATAVTGTVLIEASVTDTSAERAQSIAATLGPQLSELLSELQPPADDGTSAVEVRVVDSPEVPSAPTSPDPVRNLAAGLALGLLAGCGVAALRARRDRRIKTSGQVSELIGAPLIGQIPRDERLRTGHLVHGRNDGPTVESFRQLRNSLLRLVPEEGPAVILVTSAVPAEGRTTTVVNLALALTDTRHKVAVVDADLREPKVAQYFDLEPDPGLADVLSGAADLGEVIQRRGKRDLSIVPAGSHVHDPGRVLSSRQLEPLIDKLRGDNDYVLLDSPALLSAADASWLAGHVDGVVLSVRHHSTTVDQLQEAVELLDRVQANILGVVLTMVRRR
jgi:capsular exopolysaccharide synthesis family protein